MVKLVNVFLPDNRAKQSWVLKAKNEAYMSIKYERLPKCSCIETNRSTVIM